VSSPKGEGGARFFALQRITKSRSDNFVDSAPGLRRLSMGVVFLIDITYPDLENVWSEARRQLRSRLHKEFRNSESGQS